MIWAGKHVTDSSAGKTVTDAKRGKKCYRFQAREKMLPVPSAVKCVTGSKRGKNAAGSKRGKICNWCQARDAMSSVGTLEAWAEKKCWSWQRRRNTGKHIRRHKAQIHARDFVFHLFVKQTTAFLNGLLLFSIT